jgi:hypothetical protein
MAKITSLGGIIGHIGVELPGNITCYGEEMKNDGARAVEALKLLWNGKGY